MRQIVQVSKLIVQNEATSSSRVAAIGQAGRADALVWDGADTTIAWQLNEGFGYLLVESGTLIATCGKGKQSALRQGDLLIINEGASSRFTMTLTAVPSGATASSESPSVFYGTMRLHHAVSTGLGVVSTATGQPFAHAPSWAMAVLQPTAAECTRLSALAQLLRIEIAAATCATRVVTSLEAALFEALCAPLCAYDPLSMPQLAAGIDAQLSRALTAMAIAPGKPWRVETMALEAAMSRTAFALRFKAMLGRTPLDYLTALRIQHAVTTLSNQPNTGLDALAKAVGYADESALRRAYLRVTGKALKKYSAVGLAA